MTSLPSSQLVCVGRGRRIDREDAVGALIRLARTLNREGVTVVATSLGT